MKPDTRKKALLLSKVIISATLLYYAITLIDIPSITQILSDINIYYVILAILVNFIGTIFLKSILVWRLLNTHSPTKLLSLININLDLRFYTIFLPRAVSTGIRWHKYKKISDGHASFVLLSFDGILTLTILSGGAIFWLIINSNTNNTHILYTLSFTTVFFSTILFCFFNASFMKTASSFVKAILPFNWINNMAHKLQKTVIEFKLFDKTTILETTVISICSYILFLVSAYIVALSINIELDFSAIAWVRSLVLLLALIPVTIAGLGVRELSFIALLDQYGISSNLALSYAMASFLVQVIIGLAGSIIEARNWLVKKSD